jgi:hypothetical protein
MAGSCLNKNEKEVIEMGDSLGDLFRKLRDGMEDSSRAPDVGCPVCGRSMVYEIGIVTMVGYRCLSLRCPFRGRMITVEELVDGEEWVKVLEEAMITKKIDEEMKARNGARRERFIGSFWCGECHEYHLPTSEHPKCLLGCHGLHRSMPDDLFFDFNGWRFKPPFHCMCCGRLVCFRQWAYGRSCGACDSGYCQRERIHSRNHDGVYYGRGEPIDPLEAEKYNFIPERMLQVERIDPEEWFMRNPR